MRSGNGRALAFISLSAAVVAVLSIGRVFGQGTITFPEDDDNTHNKPLPLFYRAGGPSSQGTITFPEDDDNTHSKPLPLFYHAGGPSSKLSQSAQNGDGGVGESYGGVIGSATRPAKLPTQPYDKSGEDPFTCPCYPPTYDEDDEELEDTKPGEVASSGSTSGYVPPTTPPPKQDGGEEDNPSNYINELLKAYVDKGLYALEDSGVISALSASPFTTPPPDTVDPLGGVGSTVDSITYARSNVFTTTVPLWDNKLKGALDYRGVKRGKEIITFESAEEDDAIYEVVGGKYREQSNLLYNLTAKAKISGIGGLSPSMTRVIDSYYPMEAWMALKSGTNISKADMVLALDCYDRKSEIRDREKDGLEEDVDETEPKEPLPTKKEGRVLNTPAKKLGMINNAIVLLSYQSQSSLDGLGSPGPVVIDWDTAVELADAHAAKCVGVKKFDSYILDGVVRDVREKALELFCDKGKSYGSIFYEINSRHCSM